MRMHAVISVLGLLAIGSGCSKPERAAVGEKVIAGERKAGAATEGAIETVKKIEEGAAEKVRSTVDGVVETKDAVVARSRKALVDLDADYAAAAARYEHASAKAKAAWPVFKADMESKRNAAKQRVDDLQAAATGGWHDLSGPVAASIENVRLVLKTMREHELEQ